MSLFNYVLIVVGIIILLFSIYRHTSQEVIVERSGEIITTSKFKFNKKVIPFLLISIFLILLGISLRLSNNENYILSYNSISGSYYLSRGGISFYIPYINEVNIYDGRMKVFPDEKKSWTIWSSSSDGVQVGLEMKVWFSVDSNNIVKLHKMLGPKNYKNFIEPELKSITKSELSKYSAIDIWTIAKQKLSEELRLSLNNKFKDYGIVINSVSIEEVKISPEFLKTIEEIAISKQKSEKLKYELQAEELEAQKKKIQAQSKAQEIEIIAKALSQNPKYIDYLYVDKISDKVQVIISDKPNIINLNEKK